MILSKKRITKALIRLLGCTGWSAPVLFAVPRRQVISRRGPIIICITAPGPPGFNQPATATPSYNYGNNTVYPPQSGSGLNQYATFGPPPAYDAARGEAQAPKPEKPEPKPEKRDSKRDKPNPKPVKPDPNPEKPDPKQEKPDPNS